MSENNQLEVQERLEKLSSLTGNKYTPDQITIIKNTVARGVNDNELAMFLSLCITLNLNPFNKEIWCYKDKRDNLISFAGRDGFLKIAQNDSKWNGMYSCEVREKDEYLQTFNNGISNITHVKSNEKSNIKGAFCYIKPKGCETATLEYADFSTYNKGQFTWTSHPADMIKKVAEIKALKKAFGIGGLYDENDFTEIGGKVTAIDTETEVDLNTYLHIETLLSSSSYDEDDKCRIEKELENGIFSSRASELILELKENQLNAIDRGNASATEIKDIVQDKVNDPNS